MQKKASWQCEAKRTNFSLTLSVSFHQHLDEGINIEASHLITATGFADEVIQFAKILTSPEQSLVVIRALSPDLLRRTSFDP